MVDGLYTVQFSSTLGLVGMGVVVLNNGRLLGGDAGYYYSGHYSTHDEKFTATIDAVRYDLSSISVLGDLESFSLRLVGNIVEGGFRGIADLQEMPNVKLEVIGEKKEEI